MNFIHLAGLVWVFPFNKIMDMVLRKLIFTIAFNFLVPLLLLTGCGNIVETLYFSFGESSRLLLVPRFLIETQINEADPKLIILPMLKFDFKL